MLNQFVRVRVVAVCALAFACYPKGWSPQQKFTTDIASPFKVGPYLATTPGNLHVVVDHNFRKPPLLEYWPSDNTTQIERTLMSQKNGLWRAQIDAPKGSLITYRVKSDVGNSGPHEVRAGRERNANFRFGIVGDMRTRHAIHNQIVQRMRREDIDFVLSTGDLVETGGHLDEWETFFRIEQQQTARRPLVTAIGNHDISHSGYFRRYFLLDEFQGGKRYFSFDWGRLRVVIADSTIEIRPGSPQHTFLDSALKEGAAQGMLMILASHYPPFSSGKHGSHLETRAVFQPLAEKYGVELVVSGHDHMYERTKIQNGVLYIVSGSGGAPERPLSPQAFSEVALNQPHYLTVEVEDGVMLARATNLRGNLMDDFVVRENPPRK